MNVVRKLDSGFNFFSALGFFVSTCALVVGSSTYASMATSTATSTVTDGKTEISVMTYNVDNLFDTVHDEGKDDIAYLPYVDKQTPEHRALCSKIQIYPWRQECLYLDWSQAVFEKKLSRVADVVKTINNGRGPDVLVLEEIENIGVLNKLNSEYLQASGYKTAILIEGQDDRGIDQAILSRLDLREPAYNFPLPLVDRAGGSRKDPSHTRGLLRVILTLPDGKPLTVYAVHLPSGGNAHDLRVQAIDFANQTRAKYTPQDDMVILTGDFNINAGEDRQFSIWDRQLSDWSVSHRIGCSGCIGTEYFKRENQWSFLDAILVSKNMSNPRSGVWQIDTNSIQTPTFDPEQLRRDGKPNVYDAKTGEGVSDHLPVFAILRKNSVR